MDGRREPQMRRWIPYVVFGMAAGAVTVWAQSSAPADQPKKYHSVEAEVVSVNSKDMTITVKVAGEEQTEKVSALAKTRLASVKAGDRVVLSCKDVEGQHREVVSIRPAKEPAKK
jgi:hypothetical protein